MKHAFPTTDLTVLWVERISWKPWQATKKTKYDRHCYKLRILEHSLNVFWICTAFHIEYHMVTFGWIEKTNDRKWRSKKCTFFKIVHPVTIRWQICISSFLNHYLVKDILHLWTRVIVICLQIWKEYSREGDLYQMIFYGVRQTLL